MTKALQLSGKDRSSVRGKKIHTPNLEGPIFCRLSIGLPKGLDEFLTERSTVTKTGKAEIIRGLLAEKEALEARQLKGPTKW